MSATAQKDQEYIAYKPGVFGLVLVPVADVIPTKDNPRFMSGDAAGQRDLEKSIAELGILQPLVGRPHPDSKHEGKIDLRAGHRRLSAAIAISMSHVPVIVKDLDDRAALEVTITENMQRQDLHPLEEARGVSLLLSRGWDVKSVAEHLGKGEGWVLRRSSISKLTKAWQKLVGDPKNPVHAWPAGHLERIARLPVETQDRLLEKEDRYDRTIVDEFDDFTPSISEIDRHINRQLRNMSAARWKLDDATLVPKAGPCTTCPKRSSAHMALFPDAVEGKKKADYCLDAACWQNKSDALIQIKVDEVKESGAKKPLLFTEEYLGDREKSRLEKRLGGEITNKYGYQSAKPNEKNAVQAVVISGSDAGAVQWVKPETRRSYSSSGSGSSKPKSDATAVGIRKVQRKALELHHEALEKFAGELMPSPAKWQQARMPKKAPIEQSIYKAVLFFGIGTAEFQTGWDLLNKPIQGGAAGECINACLYASLMATFQERLFGNPNDIEMIKQHMEECRHQCEWLDWNFDHTLERAAELVKASDKVREKMKLSLASVKPTNKKKSRKPAKS